MKTKIFNVELIKTKDKKTGKQNGIFLPIWRNWDSKYRIFPEMVYYTTLRAREMKGPHLHKERTGYLTCLSGKVVCILKYDGFYEEIINDSKDPITIEVLPGVGLLTINLEDTVSGLLNICSPAWHPDKQDNYLADFSNYDIKKWTTNRR
jgi:dTDP-4-dehydrorhamnose 3,5-epimerase-like enzyme